ncbi:hypothetical protein TrST_g4383 [Triparma strigata]|uniref:Phosphoglycerate mutase n=1 Tax=Triparma strigata TaxID=1606541 RepID=A0A9W7E7L9_9STRA|nr:hypothetical protein TrST_g4383 [Triparma strigata]
MNNSTRQGALLKLYLFRHGETELNRAGIVQGAGVDASLTPLGFRQAIGVGKSFVDRNSVVATFKEWNIICSTMARTRETLLGFCLGAQENANATPDESAHEYLPDDISLPSELYSIPIILDARLKEKAQGARENKRNDITQETAEAMELELGNPPSAFFKESDEEVAVRALGVVEDEIRRATQSHTSSSTLMVTHGGVIRVLLRDIFKVGGGPGEERIRVFNSSISQINVHITKQQEDTHSDSAATTANRNMLIVGEEVFEWTATLVGPIGDTSYIPPHLVSERSDW